MHINLYYNEEYSIYRTHVPALHAVSSFVVSIEYICIINNEKTLQLIPKSLFDLTLCQSDPENPQEGCRMEYPKSIRPNLDSYAFNNFRKVLAKIFTILIQISHFLIPGNVIEASAIDRNSGIITSA